MFTPVWKYGTPKACKDMNAKTCGLCLIGSCFQVDLDVWEQREFLAAGEKNWLVLNEKLFTRKYFHSSTTLRKSGFFVFLQQNNFFTRRENPGQRELKKMLFGIFALNLRASTRVFFSNSGLWRVADNIIWLGLHFVGPYPLLLLKKQKKTNV